MFFIYTARFVFQDGGGVGEERDKSVTPTLTWTRRVQPRELRVPGKPPRPQLGA